MLITVTLYFVWLVFQIRCCCCFGFFHNHRFRDDLTIFQSEHLNLWPKSRYSEIYINYYINVYTLANSAFGWCVSVFLHLSLSSFSTSVATIAKRERKKLSIYVELKVFKCYISQTIDKIASYVYAIHYIELIELRNPFVLQWALTCNNNNNNSNRHNRKGKPFSSTNRWKHLWRIDIHTHAHTSWVDGRQRLLVVLRWIAIDFFFVDVFFHLNVRYRCIKCHHDCIDCQFEKHVFSIYSIIKH